ncbi:MAG: MoaD/ThiS family protein [Candidatus Thorarchaeota archaeon SMTZ1-45]
MKIKFKSFGPVRRLLKEKVIDVEAPSDSSVRQVINIVVELGGEELRKLIMHNDAISGNLIVMLNKRDVETLGGIDIVVHDGDEVAILPHVQGG